MKARSKKIILTNEARVLRALRLEHDLSMKKAGGLAGVSDSLIAHIETGRMNPPRGEALARFLRVYGGIHEKSFYERVRTFHQKMTPREELIELVQRANKAHVQTLLSVAKGLMGSP